MTFERGFRNRIKNANSFSLPTQRREKTKLEKNPE